MRLRLVALTLALPALVPSGVNAQNLPVTVSVDAAAKRHAISPLVYGVHFADAPTLLDLNATINRYPTPGELGDTFISTTRAGVKISATGHR